MQDFAHLLQAEMNLITRRLRGMAMISRGIVPNLVVSQRVIDRIVKAAQGYLEDETGETMVGIIVDTNEPEQMPTLYVLDTIAPDESVIRRSHMFEQGDDIQGDLFNWLLDNWSAYLRNGKDLNNRPIPDEFHVPLKHLGDWHKQPGFMIQPSGGDLNTALNFMDDEENQFDFLLVPIVTLGHPSVTSEIGAQVNYFNVPMNDGTSLRIDWWYIHRDVRVFQPISPRVVPGDQLPALPEYPWHILDVDLMDEELSLIEEDDLFMLFQTAIPYQTDEDLPLEICFIIGRGGSTDVFIVVTNLDYPQSKPRVFIAPFTGVDPSMYVYDVFDALWAQARPAPEPKDFAWNPSNSFIVDYVAAVEREMGVRPADKPMPWERETAASEDGVISISVEVEEDAGAQADSAAEKARPDGASTDGDNAAADPDETDAADVQPETSQTVEAVTEPDVDASEEETK